MSVRKVFKSMFILLIAFSFVSCVTIREGEVGVKQRLGEFADKPYTTGLKVYNPLISRVMRISTQTENLEVSLNIPSKEGLTIVSDVSILYNVDGI